MNLELSIRFPSIVPEAVCKLYLTTFSLSSFFLSIISSLIVVWVVIRII